MFVRCLLLLYVLHQVAVSLILMKLGFIVLQKLTFYSAFPAGFKKISFNFGPIKQIILTLLLVGALSKALIPIYIKGTLWHVRSKTNK